MILFAINNPKPVPEYDFEANFEKIKIKIKNPSFSFDDDKIATWVWSIDSLKPRQSAICCLLGFLSTILPLQITTGISLAARWKLSNRFCTSGVVFEIYIGVGMSVAYQKLFDPKSIS